MKDDANKWKSAKKSIPCPGKDVLIFDDFNSCIFIGRVSRHCDRNIDPSKAVWEADMACGGMDPDVTHWMELPDNPGFGE